MIGIFALLFVAMFLVIKFCKKTLKIALSSIVILVTLYCVMLSIDMNRVNTFRKPIFIWETNNRSGVTANETAYLGLGYRVNIEYFEDGNIESITMYMFNKVIAGAIT